jgi:hypothetical protein
MTKKVACKDPRMGAEGAIKLMEKLWPNGWIDFGGPSTMTVWGISMF